MISVSGLSVYPVKSFAGVDQMSMHLTRDGPEYDRRWMLVDERGRFLTQRQLPEDGFVQRRVERRRIELGLGTERYPVPLPQLDAGLRQVQVWGDSVQAQDTGMRWRTGSAITWVCAVAWYLCLDTSSALLIGNMQAAVKPSVSPTVFRFY